MEREDRVEPRLNPPSANRKAVFNGVNIGQRGKGGAQANDKHNKKNV